MPHPKELSKFKDLLLASEEIRALVVREGGVEATEKWAAFQRGENLDDLYEIVEAETYERSGAPVASIDGAAPDDDVFAIDIHQVGPVFFITANEFDDIGYFKTADDALKYAAEEFEGFIQELNERENDSWIDLGPYSVPGAMTEWECSIDIRQDQEGDWLARWRGEEGAEGIHGPSSLKELFEELVDAYFVEEEEQLAEMFESSSNPELVEFAKKWRAETAR